MTKWILALLFPLSTHANICESEMQSVKTIAGMVESSFLRGDVKLEALESSFANEGWSNPFLKSDRSTKNIAARQAFARHTRGWNSNQKVLFKSEIRNIIHRIHNQQVTVAAAKEATAEIFHFKIEETLDLENLTHSVELFSQRPVFATIGRHNGSDWSYFIVDLSQTDPLHRFKSLGELEEGKFGNPFGGSFVGEHFVREFGYPVYHMRSKSLATFTSPPPMSMPAAHIRELHGSTTFATGNTVRHVSLWSPKMGLPGDPKAHVKNAGLLGYSDLGGTIENYRTIEVIHPSVRVPFLVSFVDGHPLLPVVPQGQSYKIEVYILSDIPRKYGTVSFHSDPRYTFSDRSNPLPFSSKGQWSLLANYQTLQGGLFQLGVFPIHGGGIRRINTGNFNLKDLMRIEQIDTPTHSIALLVSETGLLAIDLKTESVVWQMETEPHKVKPFKWKRENYLLALTRSNELEVRNLLTGELAGKGVIGEEMTDIHPYELNGIPMALATREPIKKPLILRLVNRAE